MEEHAKDTNADETHRRRSIGAVNRLHLETVALEDEVIRALEARLDLALSSGWRELRSASDVERTYAVRVRALRAAGVVEKDGERLLAICLPELTMDAFRDAASALVHVDAHELPDPVVLTLLVRYLLDVRGLNGLSSVDGAKRSSTGEA
jgi:hypothetical protein